MSMRAHDDICLRHDVMSLSRVDARGVVDSADAMPQIVAYSRRFFTTLFAIFRLPSDVRSFTLSRHLFSSPVAIIDYHVCHAKHMLDADTMLSPLYALLRERLRFTDDAMS